MNDLEKILENLQGAQARLLSLTDIIDGDEDICRLMPGLPFFLSDILAILKDNNQGIDLIITLAAQRKMKA